MNCKEIEQWLIEHEGERLPENVAGHLESCAACREWREMLDVLSEPAIESVPSPRLDEKVQSMVSRQFAWQRRMKWLRRAAMGVAACVVVGLVAYGMMMAKRHGGAVERNGGVVAYAPATGEMEAAWDSLVLDCVYADRALSELEVDLGSIGRLQAKATTETQVKNASYGVVFEDSVDLENTMNDLELMVYGL